MKTIPGFLPTIHSGLSGLQLPVPQHAYPPPFENASRLTYYSSFFNSIEINSSFYKIPKSVTVSKWAASVPEYFTFTFKLWKEITHIKGLDFKEDDVVEFLKSIDSVGNKRGCLLIQFPPGLGSEHIMQLDKLLACIKENTTIDWKMAVEFRTKSWYQKNVYDLLNFYNASMVIQDIPKSATPNFNHQSDFKYIRFHGPTGNYRDSYSEDFLIEYSTFINDWVKEGKTVYVYFNNTMGDAFNNLKTLNSLIHENKVGYHI